MYWEFVFRLRDVSNQGHLGEGKKYVVELAKFLGEIFGFCKRVEAHQGEKLKDVIE